jgi:phosphate:Na+ symporter
LTSSFDIWKILAGVAIFLLGMSFIEQSLRLLAGRKFKLLLRKQTEQKLKAVAGGAVVTGLLQSSSVVNLFLLTMVGAGIVSLPNALGVMLGSNLGSTLYNWIVAVFGFKFNIEDIALPVAGIAGIAIAFVNVERRLYHLMRFFFGFSLLFIGLGFIKSGMEVFVKQTDLSAFQNYPSVIFLLVGFLITAIIQSSAATMALTLSALYSGAISLHVAMMVVLGSEIGTTIKLFLVSVNGSVLKKRVALGNFIFNVGAVTVMLLLINPVNRFIADVLRIHDPLIHIVAFQTLVNLASIILFFPFLNSFSIFLMKRFRKHKEEGFFIHKVSIEDAELVLDAFRNETDHFLKDVVQYNLELFELKDNITLSNAHPDKDNRSVTEQYNFIKQLYGEIHSFYLRVQSQLVSKEETEIADQLINAVRNGMYAAKSIKDAKEDIEQLRNSANDAKYQYYMDSRNKLSLFYQKLLQTEKDGDEEKEFEELVSLYHEVTNGYTDSLKQLYKDNFSVRLTEIEISTLINFNRELYTSFKSIVFAYKDYLLTPQQAAYFESMPGFIR